jgi:hypothetical protein
MPPFLSATDQLSVKISDGYTVFLRQNVYRDPTLAEALATSYRAERVRVISEHFHKIRVDFFADSRTWAELKALFSRQAELKEAAEAARVKSDKASAAYESALMRGGNDVNKALVLSEKAAVEARAAAQAQTDMDSRVKALWKQAQQELNAAVQRGGHDLGLQALADHARLIEELAERDREFITRAAVAENLALSFRGMADIPTGGSGVDPELTGFTLLEE